MPPRNAARVRVPKRATTALADGVYVVPKTKTRKPKALMRFVTGWSHRGYVVEFPVITQSETNAHEHWRVRHGRSKAQRAVTLIALSMLPHKDARHRVKHVRFVRYAPGALDCDNLPSAFKFCRDQVAAWIAGEDSIAGKGDDSPSSGIKWEYAQAKQAAYGVRIEMTFDGGW
jgi:hypothetical protein